MPGERLNWAKRIVCDQPRNPMPDKGGAKVSGDFGSTSAGQAQNEGVAQWLMSFGPPFFD